MSDWEQLYRAAILETDWSKIEDRIEAAESAIAARLQEFSTNNGTSEENQRLRNASNGLSVLRREIADHESKAG